MTQRERQPNRRYTETQRIIFTMQGEGGTDKSIYVTFGFDNEENPRFVREMFCADFKAGSDYHLLAVDACILVSRLLQHGESASDLYDAMGRPHSLIGAMLEVAADREKELTI